MEFKATTDKTFRVTRSYRVHLHEKDLVAVQRALKLSDVDYFDSSIEAGLVDSCTRAADVGDLKGVMYLSKSTVYNDVAATGPDTTIGWHWVHVLAEGACYGVVRYEVEETDFDYEAE